MEKKERTPGESKKINLIFTTVILVLAAVLAIWVWAERKDAHSLYAVVLYPKEDGQHQMILPLDEDRTYDVETCFDTVHLQVKDGAIAFIDSPCPDHNCEAFGWLHEKGTFAMCAPNQTGVFVDEKAELTKKE